MINKCGKIIMRSICKRKVAVGVAKIIIVSYTKKQAMVLDEFEQGEVILLSPQEFIAEYNDCAENEQNKKEKALVIVSKNIREKEKREVLRIAYNLVDYKRGNLSRVIEV